MWAREIASTRTGCGSNTVTRTLLSTWRLRNEELSQAASSTVNVGWRDCFNQNWMLWQHCNSDTAEYLETAERRV
ncbi:hypothetical protein J6590_083202 [Homalodisca vitripennis]|nr:hypothetical protein J6590_083202 [Homalodisca vitripennis]